MALTNKRHAVEFSNFRSTPPNRFRRPVGQLDKAYWRGNLTVKSSFPSQLRVDNDSGYLAQSATNPGFHRWVGVGPQFVRPESPRPVRLTGRLGLHYVVPRAESNRAAPARRRREETLHAGPPRGCASPCGPQRRRGSPPSGTLSAGGRQRPRDARGPLASDQSRGRGVPRYAGRLSAERQPRRRSSCPGG